MAVRGLGFENNTTALFPWFEAAIIAGVDVGALELVLEGAASPFRHQVGTFDGEALRPISAT
jgi:hypothetical protein